MCARKRTSLKTALSNWRARGRDERGVELMEFALILPLFLAMLFGIVWLGSAYNVYETITRAAREGARVAVARTCATCGNTAIANTTVQNAVNGVLQASSLNSTLAITTCPAPTLPCNCPVNNICIGWDIPLNTDSLIGGEPTSPNEPQELGVVVSITYPYLVNVPFATWNGANGTAINISTEVEMREEN